MASQPKKPGGSPYKVLYWMAGLIGLLLAGVVALVLLMDRPQPGGPRDPERTLLWMYDARNPTAVAAVAIIEESRSRGTLVAAALPAPESAMALFSPEKGRRVQEEMARFANRKLHNRVLLPYDVIAQLADAAGGVDLDGRRLSGAEAIAFIHAGGEQAAARAVLVMLSLAEGVGERGITMGVSDGLRLARQIETNLDLTAIPTLLERWTGYPEPRIETPGPDSQGLQRLLLPDADGGG